ncbi:hypothetical protein BLOT_002920 [Blomia tropicalis]|nr:hypothetical protein BLOT_002920 [Blomia tropicalis]
MINSHQSNDNQLDQLTQLLIDNIAFQFMLWHESNNEKENCVVHILQLNSKFDNLLFRYYTIN